MTNSIWVRRNKKGGFAAYNSKDQLIARGVSLNLVEKALDITYNYKWIAFVDFS